MIMMMMVMLMMMGTDDDDLYYGDLSINCQHLALLSTSQCI